MKKFLIAAALSAVGAFGQQVVNGNRVMVGWTNYCEPASASGTTYTCTITGLPGYVTGAVYAFKADVANTAAATINITSKGAKTIKKMAGGATTDLVANDIRAGQIVAVQYDGTNMQMLSQLGNAAAGGATPPAGAGFWIGSGPIGYYTGGAAVASVANAGKSIAFTTQAPTITRINYNVSAAGASGSGLLISIFDSGVTAPICSVVASGALVESTGFKSAAITGCTGLVVGGGYRVALSSADTTLAILGSYGSDVSAQIMGANTAGRAGYASAMSSGTGTSLSWVSSGNLSGLTFTAISTAGALPALWLEN